MLAILELGLGVDDHAIPLAKLDSDGPVLGLDDDGLPVEDGAVPLLPANPERRRLAEQHLLDGHPTGRRNEHGDEDPGAPLLHLHGRQIGIERTGAEQPVHERTEELRREVVDLALEDEQRCRRAAGVGLLADDDAKHVRAAALLAGTRPAPDAIDAHRRHGTERPGVPGDEQRSRRRQTALPSPSPYTGTPRTSSVVAGAGTGRTPWAVCTVPAADVERRGDEPIDAEPAQTEDTAHRIDDGVDGPHLVEVNLLHGDAVGRGLDLGQPAEQRRRTILHLTDRVSSARGDPGSR